MRHTIGALPFAALLVGRLTGNTGLRVPAARHARTPPAAPPREATMPDSNRQVRTIPGTIVIERFEPHPSASAAVRPALSEAEQRELRDSLMTEMSRVPEYFDSRERSNSD